MVGPVEKRWSFPCFPGYLFAQPPDAGWSTLLHVPGVLTIVKQGKVPAPISQLEIDNLKAAIHRVLEMGEEPEVREGLCAPGELVRVVRRGPWRSSRWGWWQERHRCSRRLLVGFEHVGQALSVSVSSATLEAYG